MECELCRVELLHDGAIIMKVIIVAVSPYYYRGSRAVFASSRVWVVTRAAHLRFLRGRLAIARSAFSPPTKQQSTKEQNSPS
eukprot:scaffold46509_cov54-Attheya_sp.AAC.3